MRWWTRLVPGSRTILPHALRQQMQWTEGRDMSVLRRQRIRLKFYLSNAVLYFLERMEGVSVVGLDGEFERPPVVFEQIVRIPVGVGFLSLE